MALDHGSNMVRSWLEDSLIGIRSARNKYWLSHVFPVAIRVAVMEVCIKKRTTRPNPRVREISNEVDDDNARENDDEVNMPYVTCNLPTRFN